MLGDADLSVEIALTSGFNTPAASRAWTDVTAYVEGDETIDAEVSERARPFKATRRPPAARRGQLALFAA